ncbi:hypothetical protein [Psychromicrobium sp. YIM B11713]|uniref:hypothetical protein n=1 Tax=Psychromicrobium sp. YIM B11713 TaxID=3145233 RepID=UPI00374E27EB
MLLANSAWALGMPLLSLGCSLPWIEAAYPYYSPKVTSWILLGLSGLAIIASTTLGTWWAYHREPPLWDGARLAATMLTCLAAAPIVLLGLYIVALGASNVDPDYHQAPTIAETTGAWMGSLAALAPMTAILGSSAIRLFADVRSSRPSRAIRLTLILSSGILLIGGALLIGAFLVTGRPAVG